jgi:hypothetical protein
MTMSSFQYTLPILATTGACAVKFVTVEFGGKIKEPLWSLADRTKPAKQVVIASATRWPLKPMLNICGDISNSSWCELAIITVSLFHGNLEKWTKVHLSVCAALSSLFAASPFRPPIIRSDLIKKTETRNRVILKSPL